MKTNVLADFQTCISVPICKEVSIPLPIKTIYNWEIKINKKLLIGLVK